MKSNHSTNREKGFAMLFAVLTSSVLLSIGLSIFNLTIKELALSSSGRESQAAFYAADSGVECALYGDIKGSYFATSSDSASTPSFQCAGQTIVVSEARTSSAATTTFSFAPVEATATLLNGPCVLVTVAKHNVSGQDYTDIISRGYNVGYAANGTSNECVADDSLKVERALRINY